MRPSLLSSMLMRAMLCAVLMLPLLAEAAALGDVTVRSSIGQRLDADIDLVVVSAAEAESLTVRLAPADAFSQVGIDYTALLRSVRFSIEKKADRYRVRVSSDLAVSEPFMNLLVELSANGTRTIRQYALLIDPPAVDQPVEASTPNTVATGPAGSVPSDAGTKPPMALAPADKHLVRKGETLRSIANSLQPQGVQLEQVMVALQSANPLAFVDHNVNRIRSGSVLTVPDADAMRSIDPAAARRTVRAQTVDFLRYQKQLAERSAIAAPVAAESEADASSSPGNRSSSGAVSVQINDAKSPAAVQDKLTLSSPAKGEATPSGASSKDPIDKLAADKALAEANSRISALEKNINQMQSLLEMQNQRLADAQQRASQSAPQTETASASKPEPTPDVAPDSSPKSDPVQPEPAVATQSPVAADKPPVPAPKVSTQQAPAFSLDDPSTQSVLAGAAVALLIGGLLMRSRRRRSQEAAVDQAEPVLEQTVIGESGGRQIDTNHSVFHSNFVPSISQIDANEVDAVAEADVYIAYGRDEQAEEILLDALRAHPQRHTLRVKLLEIYANRKDKQRFGTLAAELRVLTHGQGPEWTQAAQLGQVLDPVNHLYGMPSHTTIAPEFLLPEQSSGSPVADFELKLEGMLDERRKAEVGLSVPSEAVSSNTIDFQLSGLDAAPVPAGIGAEMGTAALTTKLELAIACREIGDNDGARELLSEVAKARDPELAGRAKSLLQQLA